MHSYLTLGKGPRKRFKLRNQYQSEAHAKAQRRVIEMTSTVSRTKRDLRGFTLVELLVVIGLIGFMSSMIMYALLGAQTDARVARTRSTIQKLNEVILQQWEEYRYRPVDMRKGSFVLAEVSHSRHDLNHSLEC